MGVCDGEVKGCKSIDEVKAKTKAGTDCGGCLPTLKCLIGDEMIIPQKFAGRSVINLDNWTCRFTSDNCYLAPEANPVCLGGIVTNHPAIEDGKIVRTSPIKDSEGRFVLTRNNLYFLGEPHEEFLTWIKEKDIDFDPENPIRKNQGHTLDGVSKLA